MKAIRALIAGLAIAGSVALVAADTNANTNDVNTLNFALQLEQFELDLYTKGLAAFSATDYANAGIPFGVRDYVALIVNHEQAHVSFLTSAISSAYGATPSTNCAASGQPGYQYGNTFANVQTFLATAIAVEGVGVGAYTGALNTLTNQAVVQAAATIATVEARHVSFLRAYAGNATMMTSVPFPDVLNPAYNSSQVIAAAGSFFAGCPYSFAPSILPQIRPSGVASGASPRSAAQPTSATPSGTPTYTQAQYDEDIAVFNYALTLEYLENDFYTQNIGKFNAASYNAIPFINGQGATVVSNLQLVQAHESAHVKAIQNIMASRGATAATAGCYDWSSITDAKTFLAVAATLENTGVSAYDGAANLITDTVLLEIAASVATVEARHAAYLNTLTGQNASQLAYTNGQFDQALNMSQIVSAATAALVPKYVTALNGGCSSGSSSSTGSSAPTTSTIIVIVVTPQDTRNNVTLQNQVAEGVRAAVQSLLPTSTVTTSGVTPSTSSAGAATTTTTLQVANAPSGAAATITAGIASAAAGSALNGAVATSSSSNSASSSSGPGTGTQSGSASGIGAGIATLALAAVAALLF